MQSLRSTNIPLKTRCSSPRSGPTRWPAPPCSSGIAATYGFARAARPFTPSTLTTLIRPCACSIYRTSMPVPTACHPSGNCVKGSFRSWKTPCPDAGKSKRTRTTPALRSTAPSWKPPRRSPGNIRMTSRTPAWTARWQTWTSRRLNTRLRTSPQTVPMSWRLIG